MPIEREPQWRRYLIALLAIAFLLLVSGCSTLKEFVVQPQEPFVLGELGDPCADPVPLTSEHTATEDNFLLWYSTESESRRDCASRHGKLVKSLKDTGRAK